MGRAYSVLPHDLAGRTYPAWLVREFRRLRREEFDEYILSIQGVEVGVARALTMAFGGDVEPLPRWGDVEDGETERGEEEDEWITRYKEANKIGIPVIPVD